MLVCKVCFKEFVYIGPRGLDYQVKTYSKKCYNRLTGLRNEARRIHPKVDLACETCGKRIERGKTCSRYCHGRRLSRLYTGRKLTAEWKRHQSEGKRKERILKRGIFACDKCEKVFETNTSLRAHRSYCTPDEEIVNVSCDVCSKVFRTARGLKIHGHCHIESWNEPRRERLRAAAVNRISQSTSRAELRFHNQLVGFFGEADVIHKFKVGDCYHEYDFSSHRRI